MDLEFKDRFKEEVRKRKKAKTLEEINWSDVAREMKEEQSQIHNYKEGRKPREDHHHKKLLQYFGAETYIYLVAGVLIKNLIPEGKFNILAIDNDQDILNLLDKKLPGYGHKIKTVNSGKKGIIELNKNNYDVVLVDWEMPKMDGIKTLLEIKKFNPKIPVVLITAYGKEVAIEALKNGANFIIYKPFDLDHLNLDIHKIILSL